MCIDHQNNEVVENERGLRVFMYGVIHLEVRMIPTFRKPATQ